MVNMVIMYLPRDLNKSSVVQSVTSQPGVFADQHRVVQRDTVLYFLPVERSQILKTFSVFNFFIELEYSL
jgi:hypothetical protein